MQDAAAYRAAANDLDALCRKHDAVLSHTGLIDEVKDLIDTLEQEAFNAEEDGR